MKDEQEYLKAFRGEQDGDENAVPESAAEGESETPAVAVVIDAEKAVDDAAESAGMQSEESAKQPGEVATEAAAEGEPVAEEAAEQSVDMLDQEGEMSPEDVQRQKSWEGRLRKREEELAAREAALSAPQEEVGDAEIAEIQSRLSEDFGDEFVQMIMKLAAYQAQKMAGDSISTQINPINEQIAKAIADVTAAFQSLHFNAIAEAHEDFQEIVSSPDFKAYVDGLPDEAKTRAVAVIEGGTPKQVIALLNDFKASLQKPSKEETPAIDESALDAAEGVRGSAPVSLPGRIPTSEDDEFRAAWNSM